jgi:hypothetical protein
VKKNVNMLPHLKTRINTNSGSAMALHMPCMGKMENANLFYMIVLILSDTHRGGLSCSEKHIQECYQSISKSS